HRQDTVYLFDRFPAGPSLDDYPLVGMNASPPPPHPLEMPVFKDDLLVQNFWSQHGMPSPLRRSVESVSARTSHRQSAGMNYSWREFVAGRSAVWQCLGGKRRA